MRVHRAASTSTGTIAYQGRLADSAGNAITGVLAPVMSDLIVAQGFDGGAQSYYPGGTQNTLATMDALHGYWLKVSGPANLTSPPGRRWLRTRRSPCKPAGT